MSYTTTNIYESGVDACDLADAGIEIEDLDTQSMPSQHDHAGHVGADDNGIAVWASDADSYIMRVGYSVATARGDIHDYGEMIISVPQTICRGCRRDMGLCDCVAA